MARKFYDKTCSWYSGAVRGVNGKRFKNSILTADGLKIGGNGRHVDEFKTL